MRKTVALSSKYFVAKSVNVLSKLMQKGFYPSCCKQDEFGSEHWLWYFNTTDSLLDALQEIFPNCDIKVVD